MRHRQLIDAPPPNATTRLGLNPDRARFKGCCASVTYPQADGNNARRELLQSRGGVFLYRAGRFYVTEQRDRSWRYGLRFSAESKFIRLIQEGTGNG